MANPIKLKAVLDTSELKGQLQAAMRDAANGNTTGALFNLNGVNDIGRTLGGVWDTANRGLYTFTAGLYTVERLARGIKEAFVSPYESVIRLSEASERFRMSLAGTVTNARAVAAAVDRMSTSPNSSLSMADYRAAASSFARESSFAGPLSLQSPDRAAATIERLGTLIERFHVALPDENATAIQRALENVLETGSGGRGLRSLKLDKSDIAEFLGVGRGPNDMFNAIDALMRQRVPDSVLAERAGLPSASIQRAKDSWEQLLSSIGTGSTLLQSVSAKFQEVGESINRYILTPDWAQKSRAIGNDLGHIASNILDAGATLLQRASGAKDKADTPSAAAQQAEQLMHSIAAGSDALIPVAGKAGDALHGLTGAVQSFLHSVTLASEDLQERAARFDNRSNLSSYLSPSSYIEQTNQRSEALITLVDKLAGKPVLNANPMSAVDAAQQLSVGEPILKQLFYRLPQGWIAGLDGNPQVTGIKADGAWADFASDAAQQVVSGGYATQNGRFVSEGRITDSILMPLAKKYGLQLGQASAGGATTQPSGPSPAEVAMMDTARRMFGDSGVDADVASGNPFWSKFSGTNKAITALGGDSADKLDKASELLEQGASALDTVLAKFSIGHGEPADTFFGNVPRYRSYRISELQDERKGYSDIISRFGADSDAGKAATGYIQKVDSDLALLASKMDSTIQDALNRLGTSAGNWNLEYIKSLKGEDVSVRDAEISRVMAGTTDVGRRVAAARLGTNNLTPEQLRQYGGAGTIPDSEQAKAALDEIETHLAFLKQQGVYSGASQVNTIFGQGVAGQQLTYLQSMLPGMQDKLGNMGGLDAERMSAAIAKVKGEMTELTVSSNAALASFMKFGGAATDEIQNGLGNALADVISGTGKVSAAFRAMANEILHSFSQMAVHSAFGSIVPNSTGTAQNGGWLGALLNFLHVLPSGSSSGGASAGGAYSSSGGDFAAANGAVWIPSFAEGGIVKSPTILTGERRDRVPEAIVPMLGPGGTIPLGMDANGPHAILPSGARIGASFVGSGVRGYADGGIWGGASSHVGGGGLAVHNYLVSSESEAKAHAASQGLTERDVVNIISKDLLKGGATARSVQRMGGR